MIAGPIKAAGNTGVKSGNRLTLLRDADGDGNYELQTVFADNLNAPYGLALVGNDLYVANQDAVVRFDYAPGQTEASGEPETLTLLPSELNHHWTKAMTASDDGRYLYVGIGSNSNITERGMAVEAERAMIWQIDTGTGMHRQYATGLRNPTALTIQPGTGQLWGVVQERDEIGPDLVPDYLTAIQDGGFYGWPWAYWGKNVDERAKPANPEKVAISITPDYSLGAHVAALGVDFSSPVLGPEFADGAFVGLHGSWNRSCRGRGPGGGSGLLRQASPRQAVTWRPAETRGVLVSGRIATARQLPRGRAAVRLRLLAGTAAVSGVARIRSPSSSASMST